MDAVYSLCASHSPPIPGRTTHAREAKLSCIVPGCSRTGRNTLGVRLRKPDTTAIWAPETEAHVCDTHARSGARVTLIYEATDTGRVEVRTYSADEPIVKRMTIRVG